MKYPLAVVRLLSPAALLALSSIIHPLSSASAATAYLPETSPRTIVASPLAAGEVSVVREQGGTATIYIGGDTGGVVRVAEPTGIRGWRVEDIPADELAIVTENVTVTNGAYLVNGMNTTGIVSVVASGGENIVEYDYDSAMGDGGISPEQAYLVPRAEGPELRFWIVPRANGWVSISNIVCRHSRLPHLQRHLPRLLRRIHTVRFSSCT